VRTTPNFAQPKDVVAERGIVVFASASDHHDDKATTTTFDWGLDYCVCCILRPAPFNDDYRHRRIEGRLPRMVIQARSSAGVDARLRRYVRRTRSQSGTVTLKFHFCMLRGS
jgi:hypothetical protein